MGEESSRRLAEFSRHLPLQVPACAFERLCLLDRDFHTMLDGFVFGEVSGVGDVPQQQLVVGLLSAVWHVISVGV